MEGFTLVDAGVAGIIVVSAVLAYSRGFVREAMAIVGWVGAAVLAYAERELAEGDVLWTDVSITYQGYCSDFGRTVFCGEPSADFLRTYDEVLLPAHEAAIAASVPNPSITHRTRRGTRSEVSSPPSGNQPRHARPPRGIAITAFSSSGRAKNSRANVSTRPTRSSGTPMRPIGFICAAASVAASSTPGSGG